MCEHPLQLCYHLILQTVRKYIGPDGRQEWDAAERVFIKYDGAHVFHITGQIN